MKYIYDPPLLIKTIYRASIWNSDNKILLTFDDGPIPKTTEKILKKLSDFNLKALFFCVGDNIIKYPDLTENIIHQGHIIGNHTLNHEVITKLNKKELNHQIVSFNNLMEEKFNYKVKYFRPPHGRISFSQNFTIKNFGLKNIMWSLLTYDYKNDLNIVKFAVSNYLKNNSIIVLHDSLKSEKIILSSIDFICEEAVKKCFEFGDPEECLN